jgi:hypothetical protein
LIDGTSNVFYEIKFLNNIFARSYFVSSAESAGSTSQIFDRFIKAIAKFSKSIRFLRYCSTWSKNCVRLNSRAHFTRYRGESMYSIFLYALLVIHAILLWSETVGRQRVSRSLFSIITLYIGTIIGSLHWTIDRFECHMKRRHSKSADAYDPTRFFFWNFLNSFETYCSMCSWQIHVYFSWFYRFVRFEHSVKHRPKMSLTKARVTFHGSFNDAGTILLF